VDDDDRLTYVVAITEVINRYFAALDQKQFDPSTLGQIFAPDARVVRPNGSAMVGPEEIGNSHARSFSRFRATQHLTSGFIITQSDDNLAEFRANLVAMHLWAEGQGDTTADPRDNYFLAGSVITGIVSLGANGWRISEISNDPTWIQGTGFQQVLETR
jgi:hypothetical protein